MTPRFWAILAAVGVLTAACGEANKTSDIPTEVAPTVDLDADAEVGADADREADADAEADAEVRADVTQDTPNNTEDAGRDDSADEETQSCDEAREVPGTGSSSCCESRQRPLPTAFQTVIDLSDPATISKGRCADYVYDPDKPADLFPGYWLPTDPNAYPIKLILPAIESADPNCELVCQQADQTPTAFGIGFEGRQGTADAQVSPPWSVAGPALAVSVPAPWFFVSGGCGEACSWPCLGGYQEYGNPRRCITSGYTEGFGFATADPQAPSVEAIVDLVDLPPDTNAYQFAPQNCCVYSDAL